MDDDDDNDIVLSC